MTLQASIIVLASAGASRGLSQVSFVNRRISQVVMGLGKNHEVRPLTLQAVAIASASAGSSRGPYIGSYMRACPGAGCICLSQRIFLQF